jgi:TPR repeat protein
LYVDARLFKLSADQGSPIGQFNLAGFYENGLGGLPRDGAEATRLYRLAADQENPDVQEALKRIGR